jgi:hypothetical protein
MAAAEGQESLAGVAGGGPFCQAAVPAATAVLAWAHFCLASSLGGTSISLTHWRMAVSRCVLPKASPARATKVPTPTSAALVIRGPALNCGPLLPFSPFSPLLMAPSLSATSSLVWSAG